jgi:hypothetical protein
LFINSRTAISRISLLHNRIIVSVGDPTIRAIFTHGPKGPGLQISRGGILKKIEIEVWYAGKKRLFTREKFKGDLY